MMTLYSVFPPARHLFLLYVLVYIPSSNHVEPSTGAVILATFPALMMFSWSVRVHACVDRSKHPNRENCYIWAMLINRWCCGCGLTSLSSLPHPLPTSSVHLTGRPAVWRPPPHAQGRGAGSPTPSPSFRRSTYMCGRGCNFLYVRAHFSFLAFPLFQD